jgi:hypothetical protein
VVKSDKSFNTAMGASALLNLDGGIDDTASGDSALYANCPLEDTITALPLTEVP